MMTFVRAVTVCFVMLTVILIGQAKAAENHGIPKISISALYDLSAQKSAQLSVGELLTLPNESWGAYTLTDKQLTVEKGTNWFKLQLDTRHYLSSDFYLKIDNNLEIAEVNLYETGVEQPLQEVELRLTSNNLLIKHFHSATGTNKTLFLKIDSDSSSKLAFELVSAKAFQKKQTIEQFMNAFVIGGITFTALVFMLLAVTTKDTTLGLLSAYFFSRSVLLSVLLGGNVLFLYPEIAKLRGIELPWLVTVSSIFYLQFCSKIFNIKKILSHGHKAIQFLVLMLAIYAPLSLYLSVKANVIISGIIMPLVMLVLMLLGLYLYMKQRRLALMLFSIMAIQLLFTVIILVGFFFDASIFSHRNDLHLVSFMLNTVLMVLLMCSMYYYQLKDKEAAQREALTNAVTSKEAQEQLLKMREDNQEELEQRVQERTLELNIALNELEELNRELAEKNTIDELTGLFNRRYYDQKMIAEFRRSKRNLTSLSLVVADLDFFKKVNDTYGHLAGDQCLSWLAQHIKQSLKRSSDIGCRYGGEEFCLILPDTDEQGALALAEELRAAVENFDFVYQEKHLSLTISCGVATYQQQDGIEPEHLFCAADKALYSAKRNGRNQVQSQEITQELLIQEQ